MYYQLAHLYDWPGALEFAQAVFEKDLALFKAHNLTPPACVLDLACGTGTLSVLLAKAGYQVTGLDLSEPMLKQAKQKQAQDPETPDIQWQTGDMRSFLMDAPFDAVLCHYDSLNHLSNETELRSAFLHVSQVLKPGGLFVFDLNTLENYQNCWNGKDTYEGPNYRLKTNASFNTDTDKAEVVFLVQEYDENGQLQEYEETLFEQYFNEVAVEKYLQAAGFTQIQYQPFSPTADEDAAEAFALKTFWTVIKAN